MIEEDEFENQNIGGDNDNDVTLQSFINYHVSQLIRAANLQFAEGGGEDYLQTIRNTMIQELNEMIPPPQDEPQEERPPPQNEHHECGPWDRDLCPMRDAFDVCVYERGSGGAGEDVTDDGDDTDYNHSRLDSLRAAMIEHSKVYPLGSAASRYGQTPTPDDKAWFAKFTRPVLSLFGIHPDEPTTDETLSVGDFADCKTEQDFANVARSPITICEFCIMLSYYSYHITFTYLIKYIPYIYII